MEVQSVPDVVLGKVGANLDTLYADLIGFIARRLDPWELVTMSQVCKSWYRIIRREEFRSLISFPFKSKYKLTPEQFETLREMLTSTRKCKQKMVYGAVGSGKTWLAAAYVMHRYKAQLASSSPDLACVVVVPPTCVQQWSDFFRDYTDIPVLSNYKSSCFYHAEWQKHFPKFKVFVTSNIASHAVQSRLGDDKRPHVIVHDEVHNAIKAEYHKAREVIGFTASLATYRARNVETGLNGWEVFDLKSEALRSNLPPLEFVSYVHTGCTPEQRLWVGKLIPPGKAIGNRTVSDMFSCLTYGDVRMFRFEVLRGTKTLSFGTIHNPIPDPKELQAQAISKCLTLPKLRQLAAVAELVHKRGEKLVIFDINQDFIVLLYLFLSHFGFKVYPFTTQYDPTGRAKLLKDFSKEGDILIGSIAMLGESHGITAANNIVFMRYPTRPDEYMQAFGRCHRYPQKRTVHVHLISSCKFETALMMRAMESGYVDVRKKRYVEELEEFK